MIHDLKRKVEEKYGVARKWGLLAQFSVPDTATGGDGMANLIQLGNDNSVELWFSTHGCAYASDRTELERLILGPEYSGLWDVQSLLLAKEALAMLHTNPHRGGEASKVIGG